MCHRQRAARAEHENKPHRNAAGAYRHPVNRAAGLRDNPERELLCILGEDDEGVYLTHRGRRIARRRFGEPWTILEPGYRRVIANLKSRGAASIRSH